tara:strand:- start:174 stop:404 length:231 start_codon:yes stop_codon:yes gene_type:complete
MARSKYYYEKYSKPPLVMQFEAGIKAFKHKNQWTKKAKNGKIVIMTTNPYPYDTMQSKEWQRGYDTAYVECLKRLG